MKATELRIGNLLEAPNGQNERVEGVYSIQERLEVTTENFTGLVSDFKPIPLTEEWLERFNWNPPKDIGVSFSLTTDEIHFVAGNYYKKIDYVHQLQNLYFALTGEELNQNKDE